jgi:hypothetical protein
MVGNRYGRTTLSGEELEKRTRNELKIGNLHQVMWFYHRYCLTRNYPYDYPYKLAIHLLTASLRIYK